MSARGALRKSGEHLCFQRDGPYFRDRKGWGVQRRDFKKAGLLVFLLFLLNPGATMHGRLSASEPAVLLDRLPNAISLYMVTTFCSHMLRAKVSRTSSEIQGGPEASPYTTSVKPELQTNREKTSTTSLAVK